MIGNESYYSTYIVGISYKGNATRKPSTMPSFLQLVALALLMLFADPAHSSMSMMSMDATVCSCSLTVLPANESGCAVYGYYLNHLMPWQYADFRCLREFNISYTDLSVVDFVKMCPYPNSTHADVTSLVNVFRTDTPTGNFFKSQYSEYFQLNNSTGNYQWKSQIQGENNAQNISCSGDASFCYQNLAIYLTNTPTEVSFLCQLEHERFANYSQQEQGAVRDAICAKGGVNSSSYCYPLYLQMLEHSTDNVTLDCTGIGNGPMNMTVPAVCTGPVARSNSAQSGNSGGSTTTGVWTSGLLLAVTALASMLV
jgi:hypothetical protein